MMKKLLLVVLVLAMVLGSSAALAENMGVKVIGGPETETEPVSLDDLKLGEEAEIDGYALIKPLRFSWEDILDYISPGVVQSRFQSGSDAQYACLVTDITNTQFESRNFLTDCTVKVIFDDMYEYAGWFYQYQKDSTKVLYDSNDFFSIDPLFAGHYVFGATLPNLVVESDKSLAMVIIIDGNEITYNIRK